MSNPMKHTTTPQKAVEILREVGVGSQNPELSSKKKTIINRNFKGGGLGWWDRDMGIFQDNTDVLQNAATLRSFSSLVIIVCPFSNIFNSVSNKAIHLLKQERRNDELKLVNWMKGQLQADWINN